MSIAGDTQATVGFRLSPQQRRLWHLGLAASRVGCALTLRGELDPQAMERALRRLVEHFEILRTTFSLPPGLTIPVQVINDSVALGSPLVEVRELDADPAACLAELLREPQAAAPFELERGRVLSAKLLIGSDRGVLLLALPTLAADRTTLHLLGRELARALSGHGAQADEQIQYADYSEWQNQLLAGDGDPGHEYWRGWRASSLAVTLPLAGSGGATFCPRSLSIVVPASAREGLAAAAVECGCQLEDVLLAAWQALLHRLTGASPLLVGLVCDGRKHEELSGILGPCARAVPIEANLVAGLRFRDLARETARIAAEARDLQEYFGWEHQVEAGEVAAERAFFPFLFEVDQGHDGYRIGANWLVSELLDCPDDRFQVKLLAELRPDQLELALHFDAAVVDPELAAEIGSCLETLLASVAVEPEADLSRLGLLSTAARRRLLREWSATGPAAAPELCLHELFEARVRHDPTWPALLTGDQQVTYGELDRAANRLAHHLRSLGIRPEVPVAIRLERSIDAAVAVLGVLKAGGAYVPLDPELPAPRVAQLLAATGAPLLLTVEKLIASLPDGSPPAVCLDRKSGCLERLPATPPAPLAEPGNLAYVVFTSGSTGIPKGVLATHRGAVSYLGFLREAYGLERGDRILQLALLGFDASVRDLLGPLTAGATVHLVTDAQAKDPAALLTAIERGGITGLLSVVPSMLKALLDAAPPEAGRYASLRLVLASGERLYFADCQRVWQTFGSQVTVANQYGPTECTMTSSFHPVPAAESARQAVPIGKPIPGCTFYVLDPELDPLPVGVAGELYIGGVGLARGYLGRPDSTAERFVPDPFGPAPGGRLYATGDLVRWVPGGDLEFLGRRDHQLKIRGHRVEPAEVEAALRKHPAVLDAVVVGHQVDSPQPQLVAYIVSPGSRDGLVAELRRELGQVLPQAMIPMAFVPMVALPRTPNGKVDRRALPLPGKAERQADEFVAPRTVSEEILAAIWAEVLEVERVGAHDDFFGLGGHSLLAAQVVARARKSFQVDLPLQSIFERTRLTDLAAVVDGLMATGVTIGTAPLEPAPRPGDLPVSFGQQRLWFLAQLQPESSAYNIVAPLLVEGPLDLAALRHSLSEVVRRHEILRTTFHSVSGTPVQRIHVPDRMPMPLVDLAALASEAREVECRRVALARSRGPFDLIQGPLFRCDLLRLERARHVLLLTMHHIVSDAWSVGVLLRETMALYKACLEGRPSPLRDLSLQYADFAYWQRRWFQGEALSPHLAYWRERLAGTVAPLDLPADWPRPALQSDRGGRRPIRLAGDLGASLRTLGRRESATLFMTLLAGFQALAHRYSGQVEVTTGTPVAGRHREEVEGLIGFFANTLVLRTDLAGDPQFRELLARTRRTVIEANAHQDLPFDRLVEALDPERDLSRSPLFQGMFVLQTVPYHDLPREALELPNLLLSWLDFDQATTKFDFEFVAWERGEAISGYFEYSRDLFDATTIDRLLGHYATLLAGVVADPGLTLSALPLLTPGERQQVLVDWNDSDVDCRDDVCIPVIFEEWAARTPEATAIASGDVMLTYAELNRWSNRLARSLVEAGVGAGTVVALPVARGIDFLIAVLGVFKAGGAYLPLDPGDPAGRLSQVIGQSQTPVVLTAGRPSASLSAALAGLSPSPLVLVLEELMRRHRREDNLPPRSTPEDLAYVIYTSGSTGSPKGAMVEHRGMLNHMHAMILPLALGAGDVVAQTAANTFDISVWQYLTALASGGRVCVLGDDVAGDPPLLLEALAWTGVTVLEIVPSLLNVLLEEMERREAVPELGLRWLVLTGEALSPELVRRWLTFRPGVPLVNAYGPTECSDDVTLHIVRRRLPDDVVLTPIGRSIVHARLFVLDARLEPLPCRVPGQLWVGGVVVGRGYLNDPVRTAEAFMPDPFAGQTGARMYRTGDLARLQPDGTLEFLGRIDHQVKLRGFRIELGEIETVLRQHSAVKDAVVVARGDKSSRQRLVAYVVPKEAGFGDAERPDDDAANVEGWRAIYNEVYDGTSMSAWSSRDPGINLRVWIDSYSRQPLAEEQILECVEDSVSRILSLAPRRVLEIGCGTGLLLFRVAPHCAAYWGTDLSGTAMRSLRRRIEEEGREMPEIVLLERAADDFKDIPDQSFDLVIINEVAQYFPGIDYFVRVLESATRALASGGTIFLGGLRSLPLFEAFHASVQLHQAAPEDTVEQLRQRVRQQMAREKELLVDPRLFEALPQHLPQITGVRLQLKGGRWRNELTKFRYDVFLEVGGGERPGTWRWLDWQEQRLSLASLRRLLAEERPALLAISGIPNARIGPEVKACELLTHDAGLRTVADLRVALEQALTGAAGVDPEELWALGHESSYSVEVRWGRRGAPDLCEAIFARLDGPASPQPLRDVTRLEPWTHYGNQQPGPAAAERWVPAWGEFLGERLPDYMLPDIYVLLEALPLTANGKIDRRALPAPDRAPARSDGEPPAYLNPAQELLAGIWEEVLGIERPGLQEEFFDLGGHSLLATQVTSRARQVFGVELPLRRFFEAPTIAGLASWIEAAQRHGQAVEAPPIRPVPRDRLLPLSFAQERLWFLDQLEPGRSWYNVPGAVRLQGLLRVPVLAAALDRLAQRHETLRTAFSSIGGTPHQSISSCAGLDLPVIDLGGLDFGRREEAVQRLAVEESRRPFDLAVSPLARARLVRLAVDEHVVLLTTHHIISDDWSHGILLHELAALYDALFRGSPSPLPELPIQYADFAVWQRRWLQGEELERQLASWRRRLAGMAPVLELPTDRQRPPIQRARGRVVPRVLGGPLPAALATLSKRQGVTLFMSLLAGFHALLSRTTGSDDVAVGSPIANRNRVEVEALIGFFVNTLVLRGDISGDPSFGQLLARERQVTLEAYAYQDLPFEKLVAELVPERDLAHSPLFQVMLALQNAPREPIATPGLVLSPLTFQTGSAKFDLTLWVVETGAGLSCSWEYSQDLFDEPTICRLASHFSNFLAAAATMPERRVSELPLLCAAERQQLVEWNDTRGGYPGSRCVHALVEDWARKAPDAIAVVAGEAQVSYGELDRRAERIAGRLRELGVGPETRVGVCLERSPELVMGLLGVLKAAGAYVPLDPSYPPERLAFILADAQVSALLTGRSAVAALAVGDVPAVEVNAAAGGGPATDLAGQGADPNGLAYVIYTSGSTGRPKGVEVSHRSLVNFLASMARTPGLDARDVLLSVTTLSFDIFGLELYLPLASGARVVLASRETASDAEALIDALDRFGVTVMQATPATWRLLLERRWTGSPGLDILCGGEALPPDVAARLQGLGASLWNLYGPTETTIWSAIHRVESGAGPVPLGRPIPNTALHVLDRDLNAVPLGVQGELHIGGDGVARGYLGQPGLTVERFVPDPFGEVPGARLYRTGDLVRRAGDGTLQFLGRVDHQIKIRGLRVEPSEIETALAEHPGVRESVVVVREDQPGDQRLVAYVVVAERRAAKAREIQEALGRRLPGYMVPRSVVLLDQLPHTPNGKIDRRALPPPVAGAELPVGSAAPRSAVEEVLVALFARLLGRDRLGVHDSFFDLGGHSLLATQLNSRLGDAFRVKLPLRSIFQAPTPAALAERVEHALRAESGRDPLPPILPVPRDRPLPLSHAQERLWFLQQLAPQSSAWNMQSAVRLSGRLCVAALARSLDELVLRHEALRTAFFELDGALVQAVRPAQPHPLQIVDLGALPDPQREPELRRVAHELGQLPFDLASGRPLRTCLARLAEQDAVLLSCVHHITSDGWSMRVLLGDLATLYKAAVAGEPAGLRELPVQYSDYAQWQRSWLRGEALEHDLAYWRRRLDGYPQDLPLPMKRRPIVPGFRGASQRFAVKAELAAALGELGRKKGATPFMTLLAAFTALLHLYTGSEDLVVGTNVANRNRFETEGLIGCFTNTLALRTDVSGQPSFRCLLERVVQVALDAYAHQDVPFERLIEDLQPQRQGAYATIFRAMFVLDNLALDIQGLPGLKLTTYDLRQTTATFDLVLLMTGSDHGLAGSFIYDTDLFEDSLVARIESHFTALLEQVAAQPDLELSQLSIATPAEIRGLVSGFND